MTRATIIPAATVTVTLEDVMIDQLCFDYAASVLRDRRRAGRLKGYVEATLEANPGVAALGMVLPLGRTIHLPEFSISTDPGDTVRLWDL